MTRFSTIDIEEAAWNEIARPVVDLDPGEWRKDDVGALIQRGAYNDPKHPHGWTIDEVPLENGESGARVRHLKSM